MPVAVGAILIAAHPNKTVERKETRKSDTVSGVKHRHGDSVASLKSARVICSE